MKRFLRLTLFGPVLVVALASAPAACASSHDECGGIRAGPLPYRLRRVVSLNWREVNPATIAKEWPEANLCSPTGPPSPIARSLDEWAAEIDRCCDKYTACVAFVFEAPAPAAAGFYGFDLYLRRSSKRQAFGALAELVAAVAPERPKAKLLEDWGPSDTIDQSRYMALWTTADDTFALDAMVGEDNSDRKHGYGHLVLRRRRQPEVRETWAFDDGSLVRILSIETTEPTDSQEKVLRVRYLSECLAMDEECIDRETSRLWPRLRSLAERQGARKITLYVDDCALYGEFRDAQLGTDGKWTGTLPFLFGTPAKP